MVGIYMFTNRVNGKSYVGQSIDIDRRYKDHKTRFENTLFHEALNKFGFENFDFQILEECRVDELDEREEYYIVKNRTYFPDGYNCTFGGANGHPMKLKSMSDADDIRTLLKETRLSNSEIGHRYGISDQMVSDINNGKAWRVDDITYPIRRREKAKFFCVKCGKEQSWESKTGMCIECYNKLQSKHIPPKNELFELLFNHTFAELGRKYGVSINSIKNWCKKYGLPSNANYYRHNAAVV